MKRIIMFFLVGTFLTSCSGTDSVMKDILKNLEDTDQNIQKLANELEKKKTNIGKIEDFYSNGEELAESREALFEEYQDAFYKNEKGIHGRYAFSVIVKEDDKFDEYSALNDEIKASSVVAGKLLRSAIFSDLNDNGGEIPMILGKGSGKLGTAREIYEWYFINEFDDEISDLSSEVNKVDDTAAKLAIINTYIQENPWLISIAIDFESLFKYVVKTKNQFWKTTNEALISMPGVDGAFSDILGSEEIRTAIIAENS